MKLLARMGKLKRSSKIISSRSWSFNKIVQELVMFFARCPVLTGRFFFCFFFTKVSNLGLSLLVLLVFSFRTYWRQDERKAKGLHHSRAHFSNQSQLQIANTNTTIMIRWIRTLCLMAVLSSPTGVVGVGLRGATKEADSNDESDQTLSNSMSESISFDDKDREWKLYDNELGEEEPFDDDWYLEDPNDILEDSENDQEERELHGGHGGGGGYGRRYRGGYYRNNYGYGYGRRYGNGYYGNYGYGYGGYGYGGYGYGGYLYGYDGLGTNYRYRGSRGDPFTFNSIFI